MTTTNTMTNAEALAAAIELAKSAGMDDLQAKLERMHATATKPRKKSGPSKSQIERRGMVEELATKLPEEPITTVWVMENVRYVTSPQKATAVLRDAQKMGIVTKCAERTKEGRTLYKKAA